MKLAIYCAGGLGKEVYDLSLRNNINNRWEEIFFVDDAKTDKTFYGAKIYKFIDLENLNSDIEFVIANGEPFVREMLYKKVKDKGYSLAIIIDKTAIVSDTAKISEGCVITSGCFVSGSVHLGNNSFLQPNCLVGHDAHIADNCIISSFATVCGNVSIGSCVFIGVSVSVIEKAIIGEGSILGMGSVVFKDIEPNSIAMGNPARVIQKNESKKVFKN